MPASANVLLWVVGGLATAGAGLVAWLWRTKASKTAFNTLEERVNGMSERVDDVQSDHETLAQELRGTEDSGGYFEMANDDRQEILREIQKLDRRVTGLALAVNELMTQVNNADSMDDMELGDIDPLDNVMYRGGQRSDGGEWSTEDD